MSVIAILYYTIMFIILPALPAYVLYRVYFINKKKIYSIFLLLYPFSLMLLSRILNPEGVEGSESMMYSSILGLVSISLLFSVLIIIWLRYRREV
ncbi:hypothetical protein MM326_02635 [Alkalihalobacillus sp. LMS6]|uniref:hypothetical protein n=1 Tax=Alkalihalobacillus sp. LMS6 TaxID=2924034 RepID=UPI0020D1E97F|nr:hypothetical protein [Alkalihalobacillus sp. LMS6]UTR06946.1 hypothetical protein MM326_02635 [Alkalihalobacillus sp. LMS6]